MNKINIQNEDYQVLWDYGVLIDSAIEIGLEHVEDVIDEVKTFFNSEFNKTNAKAAKNISIIVRHMVLAAGTDIKYRDILNGIISNPNNLDSIYKEIMEKSPKQEKNNVKKKEKVG